MKSFWSRSGRNSSSKSGNKTGNIRPRRPVTIKAIAQHDPATGSSTQEMVLPADDLGSLRSKVQRLNRNNIDLETSALLDDFLKKGLKDSLKNDPIATIKLIKRMKDLPKGGPFSSDLSDKVNAFYKKHEVNIEKFERNLKSKPEKKDDCIKKFRAFLKRTSSHNALVDQTQEHNNKYGTGKNAEKNKLSLQAESEGKPSSYKADMQKDYEELRLSVESMINDLCDGEIAIVKKRSDNAKAIREIPHIGKKEREDLHFLLNLVRTKEGKKVTDHVRALMKIEPHKRSKNIKDFLKGQPLLKPRYLQKRASKSKALPTHTNPELTVLFNSLIIDSSTSRDDRKSKQKMADGGHKLLDFIEKQVSSEKYSNWQRQNQVKLEMSQLVKDINGLDNEKRDELLSDLSDKPKGEVEGFLKEQVAPFKRSSLAKEIRELVDDIQDIMEDQRKPFEQRRKDVRGKLDAHPTVMLKKRIDQSSALNSDNKADLFHLARRSDMQHANMSEIDEDMLATTADNEKIAAGVHKFLEAIESKDFHPRQQWERRTAINMMIKDIKELDPKKSDALFKDLADIELENPQKVESFIKDDIRGEIDKMPRLDGEDKATVKATFRMLHLDQSKKRYMQQVMDLVKKDEVRPDHIKEIIKGHHATVKESVEQAKTGDNNINKARRAIKDALKLKGSERVSPHKDKKRNEHLDALVKQVKKDSDTCLDTDAHAEKVEYLKVLVEQIKEHKDFGKIASKGTLSNTIEDAEKYIGNEGTEEPQSTPESPGRPSLATSNSQQGSFSPLRAIAEEAEGSDEGISPLPSSFLGASSSSAKMAAAGPSRQGNIRDFTIPVDSDEESEGEEDAYINPLGSEAPEASMRSLLTRQNSSVQVLRGLQRGDTMQWQKSESSVIGQGQVKPQAERTSEIKHAGKISIVVESALNKGQNPTHAVIFCHGLGDKPEEAAKQMPAVCDSYYGTDLSRRSPFSTVLMSQEGKKKQSAEALLKQLKDQGYKTFSTVGFSAGNNMLQKLMAASSDEMKCKGAVMISPIPARNTMSWVTPLLEVAGAGYLTKTLGPEVRGTIPISVIGNTGDGYLQGDYGNEEAYKRRMTELLGNDNVSIECTNDLAIQQPFDFAQGLISGNADQTNHKQPMEAFRKRYAGLTGDVARLLNPARSLF